MKRIQTKNLYRGRGGGGVALQTDECFGFKVDEPVIGGFL